MSSYHLRPRSIAAAETANTTTIVNSNINRSRLENMPSGSRYLAPTVKPFVHPRNSSADSRSSSDSRTSADYDYYTTSTSRSTMAGGAYSEGRMEKLRVPDNGLYSRTPAACITSNGCISERHYITSTKSKSGKNQVFDYGTRGYDPEEPRASEARFEDYIRTKDYPRSSYYSSGSSSGSRQ
jgi:hypothetical protein